jgi:dihydrofolate reductase
MEKIPVPIVIVAAIEKHTRAIGYQNKLLWHIPEDLKRFKALTIGHPIIMGRNTYESIVHMLGKPLPGRMTIVLTSNADYATGFNEVPVATSLDTALELAAKENPSEIHIGGGAALYAAALPYVSRLHLTLIDDPTITADTFFPDFAPDFTIVKIFPEAVFEDIPYQWIDFERITSPTH